jgi:hypothetical protein
MDSINTSIRLTPVIFSFFCIAAATAKEDIAGPESAQKKQWQGTLSAMQN